MADQMHIATEMCRFAKSSDLLSWLDLVDDVDGDTAQAALKAKRARMQSMQHNPKYKDAAKYLIKNYRTLLDVLADPASYKAKLEEQAAEASMPMLEMAIDSVLADGVVSAEEQAFLRDSAASLNISSRVFERILTEKCVDKGVAPPSFVGLPPLPEIASITNTGVFRLPAIRKKFSAPGWWNESFTELLLKHVDDRPMRAVDLICGKGWAAQAILPERAGLEYLGIDSNADAVEKALAAVTASNLSHRAVVQQHPPSGLPLPDETVDLVLCLMSLRTVKDTRPLFQEAHRLLKPGGRLIVVEPDAMGQQFYYDGNLVEYNDVFRDLVSMVDGS